MELTKAEVIELGYADKLIGVMLPEPRKKGWQEEGIASFGPKK